MSWSTAKFKEKLFKITNENALVQKYIRTFGMSAFDILECPPLNNIHSILSCCNKCPKFESCFNPAFVSHNRCDDAFALLRVIGLLCRNMTTQGNKMEAEEFILGSLDIRDDASLALFGYTLFGYITHMANIVKEEVKEKYLFCKQS